ncbi:DUF1877 family protein [Streptomyces sp. NPDC050743]|uniref:DUF1877 family protein n=1 Tax=Streptomyces sp. NPDC050743 TaxID=3365634 RepID=UPI0037A913A9
MALTQQFARVTPHYLEHCRATALASPDAAPGWAPPPTDTLDTDWALWGLLRFCRGPGADAAAAYVLERVTGGAPAEDMDFLDHPDVHDGFGGPPRLLSVAAVSDISRALDETDLDALLARLPTAPPAAAVACGFPGFSGDLRAYLAGHFTAIRAFFREAARRGMCVVVWVD